MVVRLETGNLRLETGEFDFWKAVVVGAVTSGHAEPESVADRAVLKFRERAYDQPAGPSEPEPAPQFTKANANGVYALEDVMDVETREAFERAIKRVRVTSLLGMSTGAIRTNVLERIQASLAEFEHEWIGGSGLRERMVHRTLSDLMRAGYETQGQAGEALAYVVTTCVNAVIVGSSRG